MARAWVVILRVDYEGDSVEAVYSNENAARVHVFGNTPRWGGYFVVQEWEIDGARVSSTDAEWDDPEPHADG